MGEDILARRRTEYNQRVRFPAFARIVGIDGSGEKHIFWLVERRTGNLHIQRGWTGTAQGGVVQDRALLEGEVVSKNAPFGLLLDRYSERLGHPLELTPMQQQNWKSLKLCEASHYRPYQDDAINGSLLIEETGTLNFESLLQIVEELRGLQDKLAGLREQRLVEEDAERIEAQIRDKERQLEELLAQKHRRIRHIITEATLRNQPKLDEEQLLIKQMQLLRGALIIDGGPGTGKTTTLIDRINFLTDEAILDHDISLADEEYGRLTNPETGYLLFTPNELLMHYLKEAMNLKGLVADGRKVKTWTDYREVLARRFGFLTAEAERSPFQKNRRAFRQGIHVFRLDQTNLGAFVQTVEKEFIRFIGERHLVLLDIDPEKTAEPEIYRSVMTSLQETLEEDDLGRWFRLFAHLYDTHRERVLEIGAQANDALRAATAQLQARLQADADLFEWLKTELIQPDVAEPMDEVDEDELQEDAEVDGERTKRPEESEEERIYRVLRTLLRKLAMRHGDKRIRLTKRERDLREWVRHLIDEEALEGLAPRLLFSVRLRSAVAGPERNVLSQVGRFYKDLRRRHLDILGSFLTTSGRVFVEQTLQAQNKPLAPDELDLIIYQALKLTRFFAQVNVSRYERSNHAFVRTFKDEYREIVAVDEATDFTAVQLACMAMMANPKHNCVSLSGDLMQRMTATGIQDWREFEVLARGLDHLDVKRAALTWSYRQSPRLLDLTKKLWRLRTGQESPYRSPYNPSEHDPVPLRFCGNDLHNTADWLAQRIVEIHRIYEEQGVIPTIAIFVPEEDLIVRLADALEASPYGQNLNIEPCKDGKVLGQNTNVRIFNVVHIKGLEFEAAFFVHLDRLAERYPDLTDRMLYVGLSRASLYLGVTVEHTFPEVLSALESDFETDTWA